MAGIIVSAEQLLLLFHSVFLARLITWHNLMINGYVNSVSLVSIIFVNDN